MSTPFNLDRLTLHHVNDWWLHYINTNTLLFDDPTRITNTIINAIALEALLFLVTERKNAVAAWADHCIAVAVVNNVALAYVWSNLSTLASMVQLITAAANVDTMFIKELQLGKVLISLQHGHLDGDNCGLLNCPLGSVWLRVAKRYV